MKMAPVVAALGRRDREFRQVLVHTGQHYDVAMSAVFFDELGIPEPDHYLEVGSGTHAQQTARVMERLEPVLVEADPDVVLVPGDVNSTMAAALVAAKLDIPVAHLEAGLRSFDRTMPESIHYVGNTMIDTLVAMRDRIGAAAAPARNGLEPGSYVVVTLHRPPLVDGPLLRDAIGQLEALSAQLPVVFPIHPRTRAALALQGIEVAAPGLKLIEPLGYVDFLGLVADAAAVLTDSGGIQEETTFLGVPCFTLRDNTERPVTVEHGTNVLLGLRPERIGELPDLIYAAGASAGSVPSLWDGAAAERVADVLSSHAFMRRRS
jgi:UDP-N-acetylglucosamine 2-epimerase (non-hydrolysing)